MIEHGRIETCGTAIIPMPFSTEDQNLLSDEVLDPKTPRLAIEFENLSYHVNCRKGLIRNEKQEILRSVSGHFRPGRLTAIIGPSGAGKTSLMSIVSGLRSSNLKGSITVNSFERNGEVFRRQACYIPQEFALLPLLTVRETLRIAADLKLGPDHTSSSKQFVVTNVVNKLGLLGCLDTRAGQLSGGEKKRLSIGVELITNPPVMLLDEPTSGLDSTGSARVISVLHTLAKAGRTVVCTVHQPGSRLISMFDDLLVLSGGQVIYCGPTNEILETFSSAGFTCPNFYNIAEFVLEVVSKERGDNLDQLIKFSKAKFEFNSTQLKSVIKAENRQTILKRRGSSFDYSDDQEDIIPCPQRWSASRLKQFRILFGRAMICTCRDNMMTKVRLAAHVIVALLLGAVFYDFGNDAAKIYSNTGCLFFFTLFLFFANAMPAVQLFPNEAAVFLREHLNNWYSLLSYYMAKVLADIQMQVLCPTCFLAVAYCMTGQPLEFDRIWRVWLVCFLLTMLAQSFGIAAGCAFDSQIGTFVVPALNIPMFLFAGFFLKLTEVPEYLQAFSSISYFRYAFEGMLQAVYARDRPDIPCSTDLCFMRSPKHLLSNLGMPSVPFHTIVVVLIAWIVGLHVSVYALLRWKLYRATK